MINYLIISICVVVILILCYLLLNWHKQLTLCKEDNLTLLDLSARKMEDERNVKTLLKKVLTEMLVEHTKMEDNNFYFSLANEDKLEAIRFKRKDDKVLVYLNGAMTPTSEIIYIKNSFRENTCISEDLINLLLHLNEVESSKKNYRELISLIS